MYHFFLPLALALDAEPVDPTLLALEPAALTASIGLFCKFC